MSEIVNQLDENGATEEAIQQLATGFLSQQEYTARVAAGSIVVKPMFADDRAFGAEYPTHPLASENRFARIAAADRLRDIAHGRVAPFSETVLVRLYPFMEDCCATVRQSLVSALFDAGSIDSVPWLEQIVANEKDTALLDRSPTVLSAARVALGRCITQGDYSLPLAAQRVLVISRNMALVGALQAVTDQYGAQLYQSHNATDLIAANAQVQIVNRHCCAAAEWSGYLNYLATLEKDSEVDATPLVIIDLNQSNPASSGEAQLRKPSGTVHYVSEWCTDVIVRIVDDALRSAKSQIGDKL